ncbi:extracellular solute-binding protein [Paenibacillus lentus]|uniref:Extracellular solute-binding protein n=1 Tax=Paenibacillus lentus TaxID=1338368 RepID=A0A3S8RR48_9BACL|nr:extracellular solute-binding protein [Paenibacillus lentus]
MLKLASNYNFGKCGVIIVYSNNIYSYYCLFFITGCTGQPSPSELNDSELTLNIGYFSEKQFENRYSSLLSIEYPKLNYNVIPTSDLITERISVQEWTAENAVDLIYLPPAYLRSLANNGLLQELDLYIQKTSFSLDAFVPSAVELMKQYGDGKLYGLAPTFYSRALVYNSRLFDQYGVPYPKDQMTWEEIIDLAHQFPKGLTHSYPSNAHFLINIGQPRTSKPTMKIRRKSLWTAPHGQICWSLLLSR